jgi:hypothetical protein
MAAEQKQAEQPKWAPSEPEAAPSPTPAGIFVVYTDAQGLWAGRVAKDPGRPKKLSVTIDRKLLSLSPAAKGHGPELPSSAGRARWVSPTAMPRRARWIPS